MRSVISISLLPLAVILFLQGCSAHVTQKARGSIKHPPAVESGLMQGVPPAPDRRVTFDNWMTPPYNRWGFLHVSTIVPTASIYRGNQSLMPLTRWTKNINLITFDDPDGSLMSVGQMLEKTYTDGFIVLKDGKIITEHYFNGLTPNTRHIIWTCSQAIIGSLVGIYVKRGKVDLNSRVTDHIPELAESGFGDATLQQLLDMQVGLDYSERYDSASVPNVSQLWRAAGYKPAQSPDEYSIYDYLRTIGKVGTHGALFQYATPNTEVLGWILERVNGKPLVDQLSESIWAQLGTERDAYSVVNRLGSASPGGGFCVTLRDFARFGQMHLLKGRFNNRDIVPSTWIEGIQSGGSRSAFQQSEMAQIFPRGSFRNQWWVTGSDDGSYLAMGIYGQFLYISPKSNVVIAKMSSYPEPVHPELTVITLGAFKAISDRLKSL